MLSDDGMHNSQDWPVLVERARGQVIEILEARLGIKGLRDQIVWEEYNTPLTWKDKFNLTHGSILGIVHDFFNVLSFRHQARHQKLKGAYFVGASAHPGTGVSPQSRYRELELTTRYQSLLPVPSSAWRPSLQT